MDYLNEVFLADFPFNWTLMTTSNHNKHKTLSNSCINASAITNITSTHICIIIVSALNNILQTKRSVNVFYELEPERWFWSKLVYNKTKLVFNKQSEVLEWMSEECIITSTVLSVSNISGMEFKISFGMLSLRRLTDGEVNNESSETGLVSAAHGQTPNMLNVKKFANQTCFNMTSSIEFIQGDTPSVQSLSKEKISVCVWAAKNTFNSSWMRIPLKQRTLHTSIPEKLVRSQQKLILNSSSCSPHQHLSLCIKDTLKTRRSLCTSSMWTTGFL